MRAGPARYFAAPVPLPTAPLLYRISIVLVAIAMMLLPVLYAALVAVFAWAVWEYAIGVFPAVLEHVRHWQIIAIAAVPIPAGVIAIVFLLKPFLGRRQAPAAPHSLARDDAPPLFDLVEQLCDALGAPRPTRIDVDVRVNASASLRSTWTGLVSNDLVLTVGLPLVEGLTLRQFAGVLAHEFGHFSQGAGMRLGHVIRSMNAWFAGVVFGRDHWDQRLDAWRREGQSWFIQLLGLAAATCVRVSRAVLTQFMKVAHALSMLLARQMEFDADQAEARAVGSATFVETSHRLHVLDMANHWAHADLRVAWRSRRLGDDFPALVQANLRQIPPADVERMLEAAVHSTPGMYDSHPPTEQRIARATSPPWEGTFVGDGDARALFADFKATCVDASARYYAQLLPGEFSPDMLAPTDDVAAAGAEEAARSHARVEYFGRAFDPGCWLVLPAPKASDDPGAAFAGSRAEVAAASGAREAYDHVVSRLFTLLRVRAIVDAQVPLRAEEFELSDMEPSTVDTAIAHAVRERTARRHALANSCPHLLEHLASVLEAAPPDVVSLLDVFERNEPQFVALAGDVEALSALMSLSGPGNDPILAGATGRAHDRLGRSLVTFRAALDRRLDPVPIHLDVIERAQITLDHAAALYANALASLAQHALECARPQAASEPPPPAGSTGGAAGGESTHR
jgi:Zn-dependent protease with chaperone function